MRFTNKRTEDENLTFHVVVLHLLSVLFFLHAIAGGAEEGAIAPCTRRRCRAIFASLT